MRRRRGLTLIEMLVASALAAMLVGLAAHVFVTASSLRGRLREAGTASADLRRAHEMIARDLHSATIAPDDTGLQFGTSSSGYGTGSDILRFATTVGEPLLATRKVGETALIQYSITSETGETGDAGLWRFENAYPLPTDESEPPPERATLILPGARAVSYLFYSETEQNWLNSWEDQVGLPTAIRMEIVLGSGPETREEEARLESWVFTLPSARHQTALAAEAQASTEATQ